MSRRCIVAEARRWLGTPYRHQASQIGVGCDCLGLIRGVWRACIGPEPSAVPAYTPDWAERLGDDLLLAAAQTFLTEGPQSAARAGDVLVFRMAMGVPAKHCGIVSAVEGGRPTHLIHAYWGHAVTETRLVPWWQRRIAGAFAFPEAGT